MLYDGQAGSAGQPEPIPSNEYSGSVEPVVVYSSVQKS